MNDILQQIKQLVEKGQVNISDHGYDELVEDDIMVREIISSIRDSAIVEEYPDYPKGPCVLVLQKDRRGNPLHVVWGIPKGRLSPAVLVTAYRPDPKLWESNFSRRRK